MLENSWQGLIYKDRNLPKVYDARNSFQSHRYLTETAEIFWMNCLCQTSNLKSDLVKDNPLDNLSSHIVRPLKYMNSTCMVSLGPGNSYLDSILISTLQEFSSLRKYIPVDINYNFAMNAANNLHKLIDIPFLVCVDFEQDWHYLKSILLEKINDSILFSILGGTLGNLDIGEYNFIENIASISNEILLSITVKSNYWSIKDEPRLCHDKYNIDHIKFILNEVGLAETCTANLLQNFKNRVSLLSTDGCIPGSTRIVGYDNYSGNQLLKITRYNQAKFISWILENFNLQLIDSNKLRWSEYLENYVVLLRKN